MNMNNLLLEHSSNDVNYIEIVLVKKKCNEFVYDIHFNETQCAAIMQNILLKYPKNKFFKKHTTKTVFNTLELTHCNTENSKTLHNLVLVDNRVQNINNKTFLINFYEKNILPNHCFPSCMNVTDIIDSKRLSMKITNNIYINIDSLQYLDGSIYKHIYVNINIKKTNDMTYISNTVNDVISSLTL